MVAAVDGLLGQVGGGGGAKLKGFNSGCAWVVKKGDQISIAGQFHDN